MIEDPWKIIDRLGDYLIRRQRSSWGRVRSANWSPSIIINTPQGPHCDRFLTYKLGGYPAYEENPLPMLKRFALGTVVHEMYQKWIEHVYRDDNLKIEHTAFIPEWNIKCKADGEINGINGLEIKTVSTSQFRKIVSSGSPLKTHYDQCQFYIRAFGWETCTVFYIHVDGLNDWWVDVIPGTPIEIEQIDSNMQVVLPDNKSLVPYERRLTGLLERVSDGEFPTPYSGSWCGNCRYLRVCKEHEAQQ